MINELLTYEIYGNDLFRFLYFLLIVVATYLATKLVYLVFKKILKVLTKKTKTNLDDLIIESLEKPFIFLVFIGGLFFAKNILVLNNTITKYYDNFTKILVIYVVVWFIIKIVDIFMMHFLHPDSKKSGALDKNIYHIVQKLVNFTILALALLMIIKNLGYDVTSLVAGLGIGGLAFALAAQDILTNMFSGAAILSDKAFKVGDRIIVDKVDGIVKQIGLRSTIVKTWDGTEIIIPNKIIANTIFENVSREKARRVKIVLGLEYSTSAEKLQKAKKILSEIVLKNKITDDESLVQFVNFGASSLDLQLIYWIKDTNKVLETKDEINFAIKKAFDKEKIQFAFPSQTIYMKK
jgi:MscS family membrane protein